MAESAYEQLVNEIAKRERPRAADVMTSAIEALVGAAGLPWQAPGVDAAASVASDVGALLGAVAPSGALRRLVKMYHGTPAKVGAFALPKSSDEKAVFFSNTMRDAREFGRMKAKGFPSHVYEAGVPVDDMHTVRYRDVAPDGDPLYKPSVMRRILEDARARDAKAVRIMGIQNFEHGAPSTTYAVLDPSIISNVKRRR